MTRGYSRINLSFRNHNFSSPLRFWRNHNPCLGVFPTARVLILDLINYDKQNNKHQCNYLILKGL